MPSFTDILIPVKDRPNLTIECIRNIEKFTNNYKITIIDNGSKPYNLEYLKQNIKHDIIELNKNKGFAEAINRALLQTNAPYICLLNNDVLVTKNWLNSLIDTFNVDPKIKIVVPLTNNTALAKLPLIPGLSYHEMNSILNKSSLQPLTTIPSGFCFLFPRTLLDEIGLFDETYFLYGEETDWWFKVINSFNAKEELNKYKAVLNPRVYVFHEGKGSEENPLLSIQSQNIFRKRYNNEYSVRIRTFEKEFENFLDTAIQNFKIESKRGVAWITQSTIQCGALDFIVDIINRLIEERISAHLVYINNKQPASIPHLRTGVHWFRSFKECLEKFHIQVLHSGIVFGATTAFTPLLQELHKKNPNLRVINHIQSMDTELTFDNNFEKYEAIENISSSVYATKKLEKSNAKILKTIEPGIDYTKFLNPNKPFSSREPVVTIITNDRNYWFKGFDRAIEIIKRLNQYEKEHGKFIKINVIGVETLPGLHCTCLGKIKYDKLSDLLDNTRVFIDPSYIHSYGLPALEANAKGCKVYCWDNRGSKYSPDYRDTDIEVLDINTSVATLVERVIKDL